MEGSHFQSGKEEKLDGGEKIPTGTKELLVKIRIVLTNHPASGTVEHYLGSLRSYGLTYPDINDKAAD